MENNNYYGNCGNTNNINNNDCHTSGLDAFIDGTNLNFSNLEFSTSTNMAEVPPSVSMDNILEGLLQETHTTFTDTNNSHISEDCSYFHLQTEIPSPNEEKSNSDNDDSTQVEELTSNNKKRGNRERGDNKEAVRKYRKKLKTRETLLEDEIKKLKDSNQQLLKKLEGEGSLQAEVLRLKCLLVDIKGRLEAETSSFRYHRPSERSPYGSDNMIRCNENCRKNEQSSLMLCDQGSNGGGSQPKVILNFGREM